MDLRVRTKENFKYTKNLLNNTTQSRVLSMQTFLCMIFLMSGGTDFGSGALSGKMLLVRIVENKIYAYFKVG